jgi:hypothetical protein
LLNPPSPARTKFLGAPLIETSHINIPRSSYTVPGKTIVRILNVMFRENASGGSRIFLCGRSDGHETNSRYALCQRPWKSILNRTGGCGLYYLAQGRDQWQLVPFFRSVLLVASKWRSLSAGGSC